jgi:hypothetical protein
MKLTANQLDGLKAYVQNEFDKSPYKNLGGLLDESNTENRDKIVASLRELVILFADRKGQNNIFLHHEHEVDLRNTVSFVAGEGHSTTLIRAAKDRANELSGKFLESIGQAGSPGFRL